MKTKELAHVDFEKRKKAFLEIKNNLKSSMSETEYLKAFKGIYYMFWMAHGKQIDWFIDQLVDLIDVSTDKKSLIAAFWKTIEREWYGIDALRLNKYYNLFTQVYKASIIHSIDELNFSKINSLFFHLVDYHFKELRNLIESGQVSSTKEQHLETLNSFLQELIERDCFPKLEEFLDFIQSCDSILDLSQVTSSLHEKLATLDGKKKKALENLLIKWSKNLEIEYQPPVLISIDTIDPNASKKRKSAKQNVGNKKAKVQKNTIVDDAHDVDISVDNEASQSSDVDKDSSPKKNIKPERYRK